MIVDDSGAEQTWRPKPIQRPAERARVNELVVMVLVLRLSSILRRQLNRNRQRGEQTQTDDARPCFAIHISLLVLLGSTAPGFICSAIASRASGNDCSTATAEDAAYRWEPVSYTHLRAHET